MFQIFRTESGEEQGSSRQGEGEVEEGAPASAAVQGVPEAEEG